MADLLQKPICHTDRLGKPLLHNQSQELHKEVLNGRFVLQLDEVVNMAAAARER